MKTVRIFSLLSILAILVTSVAQNAQAKETKVPQSRTKISVENLPDKVTASFKNSKYANYEIEKAYKVENEAVNKEQGEPVIYELSIANKKDSKTLYLSPKGKILKEKQSS